MQRSIASALRMLSTAARHGSRSAARDAHRFCDRSVIVTGASNGIGLAIAEAFHSEGAKVVIADVDAAAGRRAAEKLTGALFVEANLRNAAEARLVVDCAQATFGGVDVLINNAATFVFGQVTDVSEEQWDRVLGVNVKGYAFTMAAAIPAMQRRGGGAIVNLSSISAFMAQQGFVPYSTTKAAVLQMTRNVAMDCAPMNIRVNAVCPGAILTEATQKHAEAQKRTTDDLLNDFKSHLLIKRMGTTREVANAVTFLASDDASYITGSHLMVDGGYTIA